MFRSLFSKVPNRWIRRSNRSIATLSLGQSVLAASVLVTGLVLGVSQLGGLQFLELVAFDQMVRMQPDAGPDPRLLVVAIAEADIQAENRWPLADRTVAQLLEKLQQYQPKIIGLDLHRNIPQPPGHEALLKQLQAPNLITIDKHGDTNSEGVPPLAGVPEERIGFNDLVIDPDGAVRRNFMYAFQGKDQFYSFSLRLSLGYLADRGISLKVEPNRLQLGKTVFVPLDANSGGYQNNIDAAIGYQVLLSYRSANHVARQVTLTQVLNGQLDPAWVKDKVVLIGTTAPSIKDLFFTPYSAAQRANLGMPGVAIHAQMVSHILSTVLDERPLFWFWPQWGEGLWIWAWSLVGGVLAWRLQHPLSLGLAGTLGFCGLFSICFGIFTGAGWIPLIPPALALVTTGGSIVVYKLFHNSFFDALTGLPNRSLFLKRLVSVIADTKLRKKALFAVLFLDVDRFKVVNDSLGHRIGDQLLVNATRRLKACLRSKDLLARVGGDEFAILLEDIQDVGEATRMADQLQKELTLPFELNGQEIFTSASIGIAFNQAEQDYQPLELLRDAHTAMYRAKTLGKARHEVFATGMRVQVVKRLQLETDLRRAIEQQEFYLHYQPIVSLKTGRIAGFEALVRWQHPDRGFVSPVEFIPVAEETGLIIPLGKWIFQEAFRQLSIWQAKFPTDPPLMFSVNLSGQQFSQPDLVEFIEQTLKTTGLDGRNLKLEITESVAMKDIEFTIALLLRLKALNLRLSIDDFGTGYSSLSYLHRFPVDTLKVDRSFVSRMGDTGEDAAIVQTIVMLGHNLGMDVVAEGVETAAQRAKLQTLNCEYGQGYFFSKPLDSEAAAALLAAQTQW
jgi:diguanylate cyclase (GGDEF)-like protein